MTLALSVAEACLARHRVRVLGDAGPMLLFVPGFGGSQAGWEPVARHFTGTHRVVLMDHGHIVQDSQPMALYTTPASEFARDLLAAVQKRRRPHLLRLGNGSRALPLLAALVPKAWLQAGLKKRFGLNRSL